jgi:hypothetical protein
MPSSRDERAFSPTPSNRPGTDSPLRLAELLVGTLSHDIAGPLGMIESLLEMVCEDRNASPNALAIALDAAAVLSNRLKLLRAAWGGGSGALDPSGLRALAAGLPGRDVRLDLSGLAGSGTIAPAPARVLVNLLVLADEALAGHGVIALAGDPAREIVVTIEGPRAAWPAGFAAMLVDPEAAWRGVTTAGGAGGRPPLGAVTALVARDSGLRLSMLLATPGPANAPLLLRCVPDA